MSLPRFWPFALSFPFRRPSTLVRLSLFRRLSTLQAPLIYGYLRRAPDKCVGMSHFTLGSSNPSCTLEEKPIHRLAPGHPSLPSWWAVRNFLFNEIIMTVPTVCIRKRNISSPELASFFLLLLLLFFLRNSTRKFYPPLKVMRVYKF